MSSTPKHAISYGIVGALICVYQKKLTEYSLETNTVMYIFLGWNSSSCQYDWWSLEHVGNLKLDRYLVIRMTNNKQLVIRYSSTGIVISWITNNELFVFRHSGTEIITSWMKNLCPVSRTSSSNCSCTWVSLAKVLAQTLCYKHHDNNYFLRYKSTFRFFSTGSWVYFFVMTNLTERHSWIKIHFSQYPAQYHVLFTLIMTGMSLQNLAKFCISS